MFKWISVFLFLLLSVPSINYALDDEGDSIADFIPFIATVLAFLFGLIAFITWLKVYKARKNRLSGLFILLPVAFAVTFAVCTYITYRKVNRAYNLHATITGNHDYEYYFRTNSTLKTVSHSRMGDNWTFQKYRLKSDTLLLDTIISCTGIVSTKYIFVTLKDSSKILIPINEKGERVDSVSLYIQQNN